MKFTGQTDIESSIRAWTWICMGSPFYDDDYVRLDALLWALKSDAWARMYGVGGNL